LRRRGGFPHSDIPGSAPAHGSPRLIAVFHVLHRRLTPRHPPYALSSFHPRDAEKLFFHMLFSWKRAAPPGPPGPAGVGLVAEACPAASAAAHASTPKHSSRLLAPRLARPRPTKQPGSSPGCGQRVRSDLPAAITIGGEGCASSVRSTFQYATCARPVEMRGLEPLTSALQRRRSPN
jgi:hypothetical protein